MQVQEFNSSDIVLTKETIRKYICADATDQEIMFFLELCKAQNLNPFRKDAYLIKYKGSPASIIVSKDAIIERASKMPNYRGFKAGVILLNKNEVIRTDGIIPPDAILIGGWATVYRDNMEDLTIEVNLNEYKKSAHEVNLNEYKKRAPWNEKPATMIRKVATVQAHREAYPSELKGMYDESEINIINEDQKKSAPQRKSQATMQQAEVVIDATPTPTTSTNQEPKTQSNDLKKMVITSHEAKKSKSGADMTLLQIVYYEGEQDTLIPVYVFNQDINLYLKACGVNSLDDAISTPFLGEVLKDGNFWKIKNVTSFDDANA